jgi:signal transduction histidine kinase
LGLTPAAGYVARVRLSVSTKILLSLFGVLVVFASVAIYSVVALRAIGRDLEVVDGAYIPLTKVAAELGALGSKSHIDLKELGAVRDPRSLRMLGQIYPASVAERMNKILLRAEQIVSAALAGETLPSRASFFEQTRARLAVVRENHRDNVSDVATFLRALAGARGPDPIAVRDRLRRRDGVIRSTVTALAADLDQRITSTVLNVRREQRTGAWAVMAIAVLAAALALFLGFYAHYTLRPIARLTEGVVRIAHGDYTERVSVQAQDELGVLASEFNRMAESLLERERKLSEQQAELEQAYQALVKSERLAAVGRIAAQITHEIRNPLSSIGLNAEMLSEELGRVPPDSSAGPGLGEARALLRSISREIDRLTEITEGYLRFARLPKPKLEREDVRVILGDLLRFMSEELAARSIVVDYTPPAALSDVLADEAQLRQAFLNLLRNAIEAMPQGGRLRVTAREIGGPPALVEVTITDTGVGIAAKDVPRVFDPFFSTKEHGTGLGLSLTHQIIDEHGGRIVCEGGDEKGATFRVTLRAATA